MSPEPTYAELTRDTKKPLKALVHRRRLAQASRIVAATAGDLVLDYGCGDGHLFTHLLDAVPADRLVGFDPMLLGQMPDALRAKVATFDDRRALLDAYAGRFSVISCIEVCEHIGEAATTTLLDDIRALAAPDARVVIGVPIETGLPGLVKNLYRALTDDAQGASVAIALKSLVGAPILRPSDADGLIPSHIGFDAWAFAKSLAEHGFKVERLDFLPLPLLRGLLNNEVYFTCRVGGS